MAAESASTSAAAATEADVNEEAAAATKVVSALMFYQRYATSQLKRHLICLKLMSVEDKRLLAPHLQAHTKRALECVDANQAVLTRIVSAAVHIFGDAQLSLNRAFTQPLAADARVAEHYMAKARSTLKQIVRDWSADGAAERASCYGRVRRALLARYAAANRHRVSVLVPGCGLARLNWELMRDGFSVTGNEFSFFMILTSNYLLNCCHKANEHVVYPYVLDFSNQWSYEEALRPVTFPDVDPRVDSGTTRRLNTFAMCAGELTSAYANESELFDCVVTVFFIDTAAVPLPLIRFMYRILKPGGCWLNFGPLTYHFEGEEEVSLELPFDAIVSLVKSVGFELVTVEAKGENMPSTYTCNPHSMLTYNYNCGFFEAIKPAAPT